MLNLAPHISIISGPNGSGKSTCGPALLKEHFQISEFVNADTIATGLSAFQPEEVTIQASRIMLDRLRLLESQHVDFAFETTLASRTFAPWISRIKKNGYRFMLIYFWLHSAELAIERVAERVRLGGHSVPSETIRRRYESSIRNFFSLYQPLADNWCVFDNSGINAPELIANGKLTNNCTVHHKQQWDLFESYKYEK